MTTTEPIRRIHLPDAASDRLFFAQVREDPLVELGALLPEPGRRLVVVSSGGCTALSLLARGAGEVVAVDSNLTQNHLVELKALAVRDLDDADILPFLGARPSPAERRTELYCRLRLFLSPPARDYWDRNPAAVAHGIINAGVTERLLRWIVRLLRMGVQSPGSIERVLACRTLEEQRRHYASRWDNWRWRLFLRIAISRKTFGRAFRPEFLTHVENPSFSHHFHQLIEHVLTEVPIQNNYFLHHMLTGTYPAEPGGLPPYLQPDGIRMVRRSLGRLALVDGSYQSYLGTRESASVDGFALSNILEWLDGEQIDSLFGVVARCGAPGARLVFRNFVGWNEVPSTHRSAIAEAAGLGDRLVETDRSGMQARAVVCDVQPTRVATS